MKGFFANLDEIDTIVASGASRDNADLLISLLTEPVSTGYALDRLDSSWLEPLESIGFFRSFARTGETDRAHVQFAWAIANYLKRMTAHDLNSEELRRVQRIIAFMPSPSSLPVFRELVAIALSAPSLIRRDIVRTLQRSMSRTSGVAYSDISALILLLAAEGDSSSALRLFACAFSIFPVFDESSAAAFRGVVALMDDWHYREELGKCLVPLCKLAPTSTLLLLCNLLTQHIGLTNRRAEFQGPDDFSYIWRPAIEAHEQNHNEDIRDALITATRDAAELICGNEPELLNSVMGVLEQQKWFVFIRIALHILANCPTVPIDVMAERATDPYTFSEIGLRHEYSRLLTKRFGQLPEMSQIDILNLIAQGPDQQAYVRFRRENGSSTSREELEAYVDHWTLQWLSMIQNDLPEAWRERYSALAQRVGEPEHPDFPYHTSMHVGGHAISAPTVDGTGQQLGLKALIEGFTRPGDANDERPEMDQDVLLTQLSARVQADPVDAAANWPYFQRLSAKELSVVVGILSGHLRDCNEEYFDGVLNLALGLSSQLLVGTGFSSEATSALSNLLERAVRDGPRSLLLARFRQLKTIAGRALSFTDAYVSAEPERYAEDFDPLFRAINSAAGRVLDSALLLALVGKQELAHTESGNGDWCLGHIDRLLEHQQSDNLHLPALLGHRFPWLADISSEWAERNAGRIFPLTEDPSWIWEASWCTYVHFSAAYDSVFALLKRQYLKAANLVSQRHLFAQSRLDPDSGLAHHLAGLYWRGRVSLNDDIFQSFLKNADDKPLRTLIGDLGRGLAQVQELGEPVIARMRAFAEYVLFSPTFERKETKDAFRAFGWWFPVPTLGDADWRLRVLRSVAEYAPNVENSEQVLQAMRDIAGSHPLEVLECLQLMVDGQSDELESYFLVNESRGILSEAAESGDLRVRRIVRSIADSLGVRGHLQYRSFAKLT